MTWTYNLSPVDDHDRVRLLVGDTDTTDQQLQDEEIYTYLELEGNPTPQTVAASLRQVYRASANAAAAIGAKYARQVTLQFWHRRDEMETLMKHYMSLSTYLRQRASAIGVPPYAGGLSITDKQTARDNDDLVQPYFSRDMETEPATESNPPLSSEQVFT